LLLGLDEIATKIAGLDTLQNKNRDAKYVCTHEFAELTAMCPITRLPDFYTIKLEYEPDERLIELKSLKLFFNSFRDKEILHEEIINEIFNRLIRAISPRWLSVKVNVNVRGGIETTITRFWDKEKGDLIQKPLNDP